MKFMLQWQKQYLTHEISFLPLEHTYKMRFFLPPCSIPYTIMKIVIKSNFNDGQPNNTLSRFKVLLNVVVVVVVVVVAIIVAAAVVVVDDAIIVIEW